MKIRQVFTSVLTALLAYTALSQVPLTSWANDDILTITREAGYEVADSNQPQAAIVIDGTHGQILWSQEPDAPRDPASIAKMMTVYLVLESLQQQQLNMETTITATESDEAIGAIYEISNNNIVAGVEYPIRDLLFMVTVPSSNAATVMLANYFSDNDAGAFVTRMNEKAAELGMSNTFFHNCSGASADSFAGHYAPAGYDSSAGNQSTARDLAVLTFHLINNYPEVLTFTSQPEVTVMADTPYEEHFTTYNYSLPGAEYGLEGVDGLKTGSGPASAFNYVATAKRGETRLIEVILGVGDWSDQDGEYYRHPFGNALLEKIFAEYEYRQILPAGSHLIDGQEIQLEQDFYATVRKDAEVQVTAADGQVTLAAPAEIASATITGPKLTYLTSSSKEATSAANAAPKKTRSLNLFTILGLVFLAVGIVLIVSALLLPPTLQPASPYRRAGRTQGLSTKLVLAVLGSSIAVGGVILAFFNFWY